MSKISLTPNASGTGTFTIASPNSNTNRTLTLPDADGALLAGAQAAFIPATVSGATQALDVGTYNFFDGGTLTADTTVSFSSVPTEARWTYVADVGVTDHYSMDYSAQPRLSTYDPTSQEPNILSAKMKADGTSFYVVGFADVVYQYDMTVPFDTSTASYASKSFSVSGTVNVRGMAFKPDGTAMYLCNSSGTTSEKWVRQYTLSTAWDISTASYASKQFVVGSQTAGTENFVSFNNTGSIMYVVDRDWSVVYQYSLSTAWDISTASYASKSYNINAVTSQSGHTSLSFSADGTKAISPYINAGISYFTASTAFDVTTLSFVSNYLFTQDPSPNIEDGEWVDDGVMIFLTGRYNVSTHVTSGPNSVTLPSSVIGNLSPTTINDRITLDFVTADGGTTVKLINEEVL